MNEISMMDLSKETRKMKSLKIRMIAILMISIGMSSCYTCWVKSMPGKEVKNNYHSCYSPLNTGLNKIIPINGLYNTVRNYTTWNHDLMKNTHKTDTVSMVFYPDGLFFSENQWGNYKIIGDSIITYTFSSPCGSSWGGWELIYVISKDKTLELVANRPLITETKEMTAQYSKFRQEYRNQRSNAYFTQTDYLPDRNSCWLLEAKWFWCNDEDYKAYMKSLK